jgi:hypothetical protein
MMRPRSGFDSTLGRRQFIGGLAAGGIVLSCSPSEEEVARRVRTIAGHPGETLDLSMAIGLSTAGGKAGMAMDPDNLYFLRSDGLYGMVRTGGPIQKLGDLPGSYPCVVGDHIYWVGRTSPVSQGIVRTSRFGSSVDRIMDVENPYVFSAADRRLVWQRSRDMQLFTCRVGSEASLIPQSAPSDRGFIVRESGVYWENARTSTLSRLTRDGTVSSPVRWNLTDAFFDIDDTYAYGRTPPSEDSTNARQTWFRRPLAGGTDDVFETEGIPFAVWSAGKRLLVATSKLGIAGVRLSLFAPEERKSTDLFSITNTQNALVDEWGMFWREGMPTHEGSADAIKFFYYEFPKS